MRRGGLFLALGALVVVILVVVALIPGPPPPPPDHRPPSQGESITTLERPVLYCHERTVQLPHGRVQVLVDSSASMQGVRGPVLGYLRWMEQVVSRLRDSTLVIEDFRLAQFDRNRHIASSRDFRKFETDYKPSSYTNLHEAITASMDYDLTFIITDGVAAAGSGKGDCAAGVDAACVAKALRNAVHPLQTTTVDPDPGVWIVPLWTKHNGLFFTERRLDARDFDQVGRLKRLQTEVEENIAISNPHADRSDGTLLFTYVGPRGLLLIVIARSADMGRAAIGALHDRMADNDVASMDRPGKSEAKLAALPAIEIYPGYVSPTSWESLTESDVPAQGTMDVKFLDQRRIAMECPQDAENESEYLLVARPEPSSPRCVPIYQLPPFQFEFVTRSPADQQVLSTFLRSYERTSSVERDRFRIHLQCGRQDSRPCDSNPLRAHWKALSRYDRTRLGGSSAGAAEIIDAIATTDLASEPHRVYGLESLLTIFYDEVQRDRRENVLAELELCHRSSAP